MYRLLQTTSTSFLILSVIGLFQWFRTNQANTQQLVADGWFTLLRTGQCAPPETKGTGKHFCMLHLVRHPLEQHGVVPSKALGENILLQLKTSGNASVSVVPEWQSCSPD